MAGVEKFNDRFLQNANVPTVGTMTGSTDRGAFGDTRVNATGMPSGVQSFDPTANMRANAKVMSHEHDREEGQANKTMHPAGVDSFEDGDV